ncbi:hypothetical protein IIV31_046R [Armadillidium vulgare iridescent virus]|uniref:C3H1-type domain-containing protein n=1 Tax=Armadillidium vulgare iridescent virus TaxID=72201 RepID=A0A068QKQ7_9VIRU|nr:hypothetical protein IIV31_046R [Armadillidium vulgare iridescent virus]CCV02418.1 hypothetical protein IIV31_046R [Armadillidium vulgare iridescent virus]
MVIKKRTKYTPMALSSVFGVSTLPKTPSPKREREGAEPEAVIKKNRQCKYGAECKLGQRCVFLHPGEKFERPERPERPENTGVERQGPKEHRKTRMCKYLKRCGKGENCPFAHKEEDLYVRECRFGYKCKKTGTGDPEIDTCTFKHPPAPVAIVEEVKEENFELTTESFPSVGGFDTEVPVPSIDFSCLQDEDFHEKRAIEMMKRSEEQGIVTLKGTIEEIVDMFETDVSGDVIQYNFVLN